MELKNDYKFKGRVKISGKWIFAPILLQKNFHLRVCLPDVYRVDKGNEIPEFIEGQIKDWNIQINDSVLSVSSWHSTFYEVMEKNQFSAGETDFISEEDRRKVWSEITVFPEICTFIKEDHTNEIPDKWGLTFYPDRVNNSLFKLFDRNRNPRKPPDILTSVDVSHYFDNIRRWSLTDIRQRLKLITSCLSLFAGAPVTYQLLVGRYDKEILCFQIKNVANPNAYICPGHFNGCADIKEEYLDKFPSKFINTIDDIFKKDKQQEISILLSYFDMLYTSLYHEAKIAFSYQLMESSARYKGIKFGSSYRSKITKNLSKKLCPSCRAIIDSESKMESDEFIGLIGKALKVVKIDKDFKAQPSAIKKVAMSYRNHVFHGSFFESMSKIDKIVNSFPEGYRVDLPELFQAIISVIGANLILGIDFKDMKAIKREIKHEVRQHN